MTSPPTKSLDLPNGDSLSSARPTSLNWSLESLLSFPNHNFVSVRRISAQLPKEDLAKEIQLHEHKGIPLIIEGWHLLSGWNSDTFTAEWLAKKFEEPMNFWELYAQEDHSMTVSAFLDICRSSKEHAEADEKQRFYGKDITFPSEWEESLRILPPSVLPLSEGDSFTMLDPKDRPETIMGYMGIGDTFTPAHKDTSASTGYNIMVHTSAINSQDLPPDEGDTTNYNALIESGDASAFWFLTAAEDAAAASQYFSNKLGQTLDLQAHYASLEEFMGGNFKVYVCQQVLGDLVIIPRQSCHQVMNHGGLSTKVAWSRMPFRSIEAALLEELPVYRRVGRDEIYRVKRLLERSVRAWTTRFPNLTDEEKHYFPRFLRFLTDLHVEEYHEDHEEHLSEDQSERLTCDACAADIYQAYFECTTCNQGEAQGSYIACPTCFVEGRSCRCTIMRPRISRPWQALLDLRNEAAAVLDLPLMSLQDYANEIPVKESGISVLRPNRISLFKAGIILAELRRYDIAISGGRPKLCNGNARRSSHTPAMPALVTCRDCHRTTCFKHLLDSMTHAVEALLVLGCDGAADRHPNRRSSSQANRGKGIGRWHIWHQKSKPRLKAANAPGSEEYHHQLFRLLRAAQTYSTFRPVDEARTKLGWYDTTFEGEDDELAESPKVSPNKKKRESSVSIKNLNSPLKPPPLSSQASAASISTSGSPRATPGPSSSLKRKSIASMDDDNGGPSPLKRPKKSLLTKSFALPVAKKSSRRVTTTKQASTAALGSDSSASGAVEIADERRQGITKEPEPMQIDKDLAERSGSPGSTTSRTSRTSRRSLSEPLFISNGLLAISPDPQLASSSPGTPSPTHDPPPLPSHPNQSSRASSLHSPAHRGSKFTSSRLTSTPLRSSVVDNEDELLLVPALPLNRSGRRKSAHRSANDPSSQVSSSGTLVSSQRSAPSSPDIPLQDRPLLHTPFTSISQPQSDISANFSAALKALEKKHEQERARWERQLEDTRRDHELRIRDLKESHFNALANRSEQEKRLKAEVVEYKARLQQSEAMMQALMIGRGIGSTPVAPVIGDSPTALVTSPRVSSSLVTSRVGPTSPIRRTFTHSPSRSHDGFKPLGPLPSLASPRQSTRSQSLVPVVGTQHFDASVGDSSSPNGNASHTSITGPGSIPDSEPNNEAPSGPEMDASGESDEDIDISLGPQTPSSQSGDIEATSTEPMES